MVDCLRHAGLLGDGPSRNIFSPRDQSSFLTRRCFGTVSVPCGGQKIRRVFNRQLSAKVRRSQQALMRRPMKEACQDGSRQSLLLIKRFTENWYAGIITAISHNPKTPFRPFQACSTFSLNSSVVSSSVDYLHLSLILSCFGSLSGKLSEGLRLLPSNAWHQNHPYRPGRGLDGSVWLIRGVYEAIWSLRSTDYSATIHHL